MNLFSGDRTPAGKVFTVVDTLNANWEGMLVQGTKVFGVSRILRDSEESARRLGFRILVWFRRMFIAFALAGAGVFSWAWIAYPYFDWLQVLGVVVLEVWALRLAYVSEWGLVNGFSVDRYLVARGGRVVATLQRLPQ
jgi:hypothetical protein